MAYDADECTQALPVVDVLTRASLWESLACEATLLPLQMASENSEEAACMVAIRPIGFFLLLKNDKECQCIACASSFSYI